MEKVTETLHSKGCSLVVESRGELHLFYNRGIKDLYTIFSTSPELLQGAKVADKVVGRAAAALMILGGVKAIYADTISDLALETLRGSGISVSFGTTTPHIINRTKTDLCPMERATKDLDNLSEIVAAIERFVASLA